MEGFRVLGRNIIVEPIREPLKKTSYGLELTPGQRDEERYQRGIIRYIGEDVVGVSVGDKIIFDKVAGHFIDLDEVEEQVRVITDFDIKLVI